MKTKDDKKRKLMLGDFGEGCPICGGYGGYIYIGRNEWRVCHKHKVKWSIGENAFGFCKDKHEIEEDRVRNRKLFFRYKEVRPVSPPQIIIEGGRINLSFFDKDDLIYFCRTHNNTKNDLDELLDQAQWPEDKPMPVIRSI
jgi:hypothetical protein